jgi:hypothetical protein
MEHGLKIGRVENHLIAVNQKHAKFMWIALRKISSHAIRIYLDDTAGFSCSEFD